MKKTVKHSDECHDLRLTSGTNATLHVQSVFCVFATDRARRLPMISHLVRQHMTAMETARSLFSQGKRQHFRTVAFKLSVPSVP